MILREQTIDSLTVFKFRCEEYLITIGGGATKDLISMLKVALSTKNQSINQSNFH
jgi:3-dehydroquinate synthetase